MFISQTVPNRSYLTDEVFSTDAGNSSIAISGRDVAVPGLAVGYCENQSSFLSTAEE